MLRTMFLFLAMAAASSAADLATWKPKILEVMNWAYRTNADELADIAALDIMVLSGEGMEQTNLVPRPGRTPRQVLVGKTYPQIQARTKRIILRKIREQEAGWTPPDPLPTVSAAQAASSNNKLIEGETDWDAVVLNTTVPSPGDPP